MIKRLLITGLCLLLVLALAGCGGVRITDDMTPTETADAFLECIKTQDDENMAKIYEGEGNDFLNIGSDDSIKQAMEEKWLDFDYEMGKETISEDGKTATVEVEINTYDMAAVFNEYLTEYMEKALDTFSGSAATTMTDEALKEMSDEILAEKVAEAAEKTYFDSATLSLTRRDGRWIVDEITSEDKDFINAITGGMIRVMDEVADTLTENGAASGTADDSKGGNK